MNHDLLALAIVIWLVVSGAFIGSLFCLRDKLSIQNFLLIFVLLGCGVVIVLSGMWVFKQTL